MNRKIEAIETRKFKTEEQTPLKCEMMIKRESWKHLQ